MATADAEGVAARIQKEAVQLLDVFLTRIAGLSGQVRVSLESVGTMDKVGAQSVRCWSLVLVEWRRLQW